MIRRSTFAVLVSIGSSSASGCQCADRPVFEQGEGTSSTGLETSASDGVTATAGDSSTADAAEEPVDVSRFIGVFHNENGFVPLGEEVDNPGEPTLMNLEIRADGTASMTLETCSQLLGTREYAWRWEAQPGPWLVFSPGPGEESLRFMARDDLESLRLTPVNDCDLQFEVDGDFVPYETFRPGRACWVNRCEPTWVVEIDYCEGEDSTPCD
ncbi:hypothetical protein [Paraliomyxa miuraensis]|uniref:hypothetical protein n=1 Tax=Paraliomyxa miuraensis TaxID=376150 RepID=UPI00225A4AAB|nr:hypothetical protein [Paraliomyxa miuraensis]MCX4244406.1 hypothetical protein [Paraliomyxa miuraensis]